jgi:HD-GYP domain-containing protein (c-di-GMP phosphodiesterase class II)
MKGSNSKPYLFGSVDSVTVALDARDSYTRSHCDRVLALATSLGEACDVSGPALDSLRVCAQFHDIGKIGVPDAVLLKPGRLDADEWVVMKTHAEIGERIFRAMALDGSEPAAEAIRHHHESFDGSGYPDGLAREAIPLASRVMLVVDAYDAMATARPYHRARSHDEVMEILASESGKKLDPAIFLAFAKLIVRSPARAN